MQILKTTRVSNYNLDFMIICLAENIIEHCKDRLQRILSANVWLIVLSLHTGPKVRTVSPAARRTCVAVFFSISSLKRGFPASRGLSRRGKTERRERDLCRLPTRCVMKPPTRFLAETYRFLKPVPFIV